MSRQSVLIVSPIASHPADQGNSARIRAEADELRRRGFAVDFFYYGMEGLSQQQAEAMTSYWRQFFFLKSRALPPPSLAMTWGIDDWCSDHLCDQVARVVAENQYDAVIVNYVWMSKVLNSFDGPTKIIDTHDLFGDRNKVSMSAGIEPRWFFTSLEEEDRGFRRADIVIGIQKNETAKIAARVECETITVGHPIEAHFLLRAAPRSEPSFTFGYIGSGNPFNVRSIRALDRMIAAHKNLDWLIAGSITKDRLDLQSCPYLMGMVDQLNDFYDSVDCVLNPMIGGTGLKIKTIEALAFGRPIIGTFDAFDGIEVEHPFHRLGSLEGMVDAMAQYKASATVRRELQRQTYRVFASYMAGVSSEYDRLASMICEASRHGVLAGTA